MALQGCAEAGLSFWQASLDSKVGQNYYDRSFYTTLSSFIDQMRTTISTEESLDTQFITAISKKFASVDNSTRETMFIDQKTFAQRWARQAV